MGSPETMETWAKIIKSKDEIPEEYADKFDIFPIFPYSVYIPILRSPPEIPSCEKIISSYDNKLHIFENHGGLVETFSFFYSEIDHIEKSKILLNSRLTIAGKRNDSYETKVIDFNTVNDPYFEIIIDNIRKFSVGNHITDLEAEKSKFDVLSKDNYKFMNYSKSAIIKGEKIIRFIYQPEIKKKYYKIFTKRKPPLLLILTDKEIIIIREDDNKHGTSTGKYGVIILYIPIIRIKTLEIEEYSNEMSDEKKFFNLKIIQDSSEQNISFGKSLKSQIDDLINEFRQLNNS